MAFDMAYMSGLLKIVACFLAPVVLFRIWAFGLKPLLHPDEPKELPYWIPCKNPLISRPQDSHVKSHSRP